MKGLRISKIKDRTHKRCSCKFDPFSDFLRPLSHFYSNKCAVDGKDFICIDCRKIWWAERNKTKRLNLEKELESTWKEI